MPRGGLNAVEPRSGLTDNKPQGGLIVHYATQSGLPTSMPHNGLTAVKPQGGLTDDKPQRRCHDELDQVKIAQHSTPSGVAYRATVWLCRLTCR